MRSSGRGALPAHKARAEAGRAMLQTTGN